MKEAFWGVLIVVLGVFGIVVVNLFQNITVENDRTYYVIKEATEGAAFDAIDLAHYRLNGTLRIVEDKFVENLTRRFAENISKSNYKIVVEDINEMPPKVSLRVETGVGMLNTGLFGKEDPFNIVNRVDAIIETKYTVEDLEFAGITEEEWKEKLDEPIKDNVCTPTIGDVDDACIDGDIMYTGDEEINIQNKICIGQTPPSNVSKKVNYKVCECGKWVEKSETLVSSPRKNGREWIYEWTFNIEGKNRVINQVIKERVLELQCTDGIQVYVPDDIDEKNQNNVTIPYQPSTDNSRYEICPAEGIKIPIGMSFIAHPNYIPQNSVNRNLIWSIADESILGLVGRNPGIYCNMDKKPCYSTGEITTKKLGTTYIKVETTEIDGRTKRGQSATCKVEVYDGKVDSIGCKDINVEVGKSAVIVALPNPKNATILNYTYSIADTSIATLSGNNINGKQGGTTTLTITETNTGKTGTCTIKVPSPPSPPMSFSGSDYSGGSSTSSGGYWKVTDSKGNSTYYSSYGKAQEAARKNISTTSVISYKNSGSSTEIKYSTLYADSPNAFHEDIYNGNKNPQEKKYTEIPPPPPPVYYYDPPAPSYSRPNRVPSNPTTNVQTFCLEKNTKVLTLNGYKNISDIKVGDKVLSYNPEKNINEFKNVNMVFIHKKSYDVVYTFVVNNKKISATRLHQFYVKTNKGYEYIKAENLKIGHLLVSADGNYYPIRRISSEFKLSDYYDLSVDDNKNFYIGRDNILVHNAPTK